MAVPRTVSFLTILVAFGLVALTFGQTTSTGQRETGDELIYVQYKEGASLEPDVLSNITLTFKYDGGAAISSVTFVNFYTYSDTISHWFTFLRGGAGLGLNYADYEYSAIDATYFRVQVNYYGFRT